MKTIKSFSLFFLIISLLPLNSCKDGPIESVDTKIQEKTNTLSKNQASLKIDKQRILNNLFENISALNKDIANKKIAIKKDFDYSKNKDKLQNLTEESLAKILFESGVSDESSQYSSKIFKITKNIEEYKEVAKALTFSDDEFKKLIEADIKVGGIKYLKDKRLKAQISANGRVLMCSTDCWQGASANLDNDLWECEMGLLIGVTGGILAGLSTAGLGAGVMTVTILGYYACENHAFQAFEIAYSGCGCHGPVVYG